MWPREEAIAFFAKRGEPLKVQLIEEKTAGQSRRLLLHDQGPRHVRRLLRRPARAVDGQAQGVQAARRRRTPTGRATRRTSRCSAIYGTAFFTQKELDEHLKRHRGSEEARPPQGRQGARPLHVPSVGAGRDVLARQGHDALQHARRLHARRALPGRLRRGEDADRLQQGALGDVRALGHYRENMFLVESARRRARWASRPMNCPGHLLLFAQRDAQLPRSAAALPRADAAPPQRSLRRARRASRACGSSRRTMAHCFVTEDRRSARKSRRCSSWCSASTATSASSTRRSCRRVPRSSSARSRRGTTPRRRCRRALERAGAAVHARSGRRRVLRPEDRLRHHRRARPEVAVRARFSSTT